MKRREFFKAGVTSAVTIAASPLYISCKENKDVQVTPQEINAQVAAISI